MKIIGKTDGGFILSGSDSEVANIVGLRFSSDLKASVGTTIDVHEIYQRISEIRGMKKTLIKICDELSSSSAIIRKAGESVPLVEE